MISTVERLHSKSKVMDHINECSSMCWALLHHLSSFNDRSSWTLQVSLGRITPRRISDSFFINLDEIWRREMNRKLFTEATNHSVATKICTLRIFLDICQERFPPLLIKRSLTNEQTKRIVSLEKSTIKCLRERKTDEEPCRTLFVQWRKWEARRLHSTGNSRFVSRSSRNGDIVIDWWTKDAMMISLSMRVNQGLEGYTESNAILRVATMRYHRSQREK